jgi:hypothetical protein
MTSCPGDGFIEGKVRRADGVREKASKSSMRQMILWVVLNAGILLFELISVVTKGSPNRQVQRALAF